MISSSNKFAVMWIAHNTFILHYWYLAMSVCSRSCQISHAHFLFFKLPIFLENIILTQLTPLGMIFPAKFSYLEHLGKL